MLPINPSALRRCPYNSHEVTAELMRNDSSDGKESFGRRLARLRKAAGYSQRDLAAEISISHRMMAYYEAQTSRPPAQLLPALADALSVSTDQLLGRKPTSSRKSPRNERLFRQLRKVESLPPKARNAVLEHIEALAAKYADS